MDAKRPVVENDILPDNGAGLALAVDAVVEIVGPTVVIGDRPVHLAAAGFVADVNTACAGVMDHQVNQTGTNAADIYAEDVDLIRFRVRNLETPEPCVRANDVQEFRDDSMLARILPDDNRIARGTGQGT